MKIRFSVEHLNLVLKLLVDLHKYTKRDLISNTETETYKLDLYTQINKLYILQDHINFRMVTKYFSQLVLEYLKITWMTQSISFIRVPNTK